MLPLLWSLPIHLPAFLRSTPVTKFLHYYERSDCCSLGSSGPAVHELRPFCEQLSLIHVNSLPYHSVSTHPTPLCRRFITLPLSSTAFLVGLDFARGMEARRLRKAVSSSLSYGLVVHLLLLSTTHRCVAVAFGYGPESVCPKRTFTPLTIALSGAHTTDRSRWIVHT